MGFLVYLMLRVAFALLVVGGMAFLITVVMGIVRMLYEGWHERREANTRTDEAPAPARLSPYELQEPALIQWERDFYEAVHGREPQVIHAIERSGLLDVNELRVIHHVRRDREND